MKGKVVAYTSSREVRNAKWVSYIILTFLLKSIRNFTDIICKLYLSESVETMSNFKGFFKSAV